MFKFIMRVRVDDVAFHSNRGRKRMSATVRGVLLACLLTGCMNVKQTSAFRNAGNPADNKATLFISYLDRFDSVKIDGQDVYFFGPGWGSAAWMVEMLPGQHQVEIVWPWRGGTRLSGNFMAENGKSYILETETTATPLRVNSVLHLNRVYIAELPPGTTYKLSFPEGHLVLVTKGDQVLKTYKTVAELHLTETTK